jgi:DNA-directed RNA polymerase subunit RPC12/RpoP
MRLAEGIRKHGFRKWYERELLQSHAHLVLTFLCAIGVFAAVESMAGSTGVGDKLVDLAAVLVCAGVGVWALRRYLYFLTHAEVCANQADCPQCKAYAKIAIDTVHDDEARLEVHCKQCGHRWTIHDV